MSVRSILKRLLSRNAEDPSVPLTWENLIGCTMQSTAGVEVSERTALTLAAVWRAVSKISGTVGRLPLHLYKRDGEDRARDVTHPAYRLARSMASAYVPASTFRQTLLAHRLLHGNGYALIERTNAGIPLELIAIDPTWVTPVRVNGVPWYVVDDPNENKRYKFRAEDMIHIRGLGPDPLRGYSVIEYATNSFGIGLAASEFTGRFFSNSAIPGLILETGDALNPHEVKKLRADWDKIHLGVGRTFRPAILPKGMSAKPLSISPQHAQLIELRGHEIRDVATWFGIPPHFLGDTTRTAYASLEQESRDYLDAIEDHLVVWEQEFAVKLLRPEELNRDTHFFEFERKALLQIDAAARSAFYGSATGGVGWMTPNEVRRRENMPPLPGPEGDTVFVPMNMQPSSAQPDEATHDDPETPAGPAEDDAGVPDESTERASRMTAALRDILYEAVCRTVRRYAADARRAVASGQSLKEWTTGPRFAKHCEMARRMLGPAIGAALSIRDVDPSGTEAAMDAAVSVVRTGVLANLPAYVSRVTLHADHVDDAELDRWSSQFTDEIASGLWSSNHE